MQHISYQLDRFLSVALLDEKAWRWTKLLSQTSIHIFRYFSSSQELTSDTIFEGQANARRIRFNLPDGSESLRACSSLLFSNDETWLQLSCVASLKVFSTQFWSVWLQLTISAYATLAYFTIKMTLAARIVVIWIELIFDIRLLCPFKVSGSSW